MYLYFFLFLWNVFLPRNAWNSRKRRGCAMILLDILEELGRCAALDFAVRCFSFGVFFLTEFTERTEFFYSRTRCLTSSNALDGMHGNLSLCDNFFLRFISFLFFNLLFCYVKDDLWIYMDFFGLSTERTHEPYVPTIRGVVV